MPFNNSKNSLSLSYQIANINGDKVKEERAINKAIELELRLHNLLATNAKYKEALKLTKDAATDAMGTFY